jgi:hypothetical protein
MRWRHKSAHLVRLAHGLEVEKGTPARTTEIDMDVRCVDIRKRSGAMRATKPAWR